MHDPFCPFPPFLKFRGGGGAEYSIAQHETFSRGQHAIGYETFAQLVKQTFSRLEQICTVQILKWLLAMLLAETHFSSFKHTNCQITF